MKFASALLASSFLFVAEPQLRAAGPDDIYFDAYRLIQEGDQLSVTAQAETARQRYQDAEQLLKRIQAGYPNYSKQAVEFRLEYLRAKLQALPAARPAQPSAQTAVQPARPVPAANALEEMNGRVARLESDNALLQAKLQEALAARPAAADPAEFNRAQERIKQLEKEKELLRASLQQAEAKQPNSADAMALAQLKKEAEADRAKLLDSISRVAELTRENQQLKQQPAPAASPGGNSALETERAAWQKERADLEAKIAAAAKPQSDNVKVKELEKERDALLKRLNDANKELYDVKARGQAAQLQTLTNQVSNLRARLEVFEARKVPFTKEELALMDKTAPRLATSVDPKAGKRAPREIPAGAAVLVAEAERAFAGRRFAEAEQKYTQVLRMDEENPVSLANLAAIQIEMQKLDEAEANLKKATAIAPDDSYALTLMGMLRFQQGKFDEALEVLSRAAQLDPKNPETQNYLGITLSQQGQREAAETALRKAIQLNPNYGIAHHNLAVVYATQRPPFIELAKYHYSRALALGHPGTPELEKQIGR